MRVATVDVLAACHADLFIGFADAYPGIDLEVVTGYGMHSLDRREADVALRFGVPDESLFGRKLVRVGYAAFAHRSLAGEGRPSLADLPWLTWTPMIRATRTDRWLATTVPGVRVACSYDAGLVLLAAIQAGGGGGDPGLRPRQMVPGKGSFRGLASWTRATSGACGSGTSGTPASSARRPRDLNQTAGRAGQNPVEAR